MLIPHGALILVVDGSRMQLLRNRGRDSAPELEVIEDEKLGHGRGQAAETGGRSSGGPAHRADPDPHQRREDRFGRQAMQFVESAARRGAPVILIAPPHMLGELRAARDPHVEGQIVAEIDKDLSHCKPAELATFLQDYRA